MGNAWRERGRGWTVRRAARRAEIAGSQTEIVGCVIRKVQQLGDLAARSKEQNQQNNHKRGLFHNSPSAGALEIAPFDPAVLATLLYRLFYHQHCGRSRRLGRRSVWF